MVDVYLLCGKRVRVAQATHTLQLLWTGALGA